MVRILGKSRRLAQTLHGRNLSSEYRWCIVQAKRLDLNSGDSSLCGRGGLEGELSLEDRFQPLRALVVELRVSSAREAFSLAGAFDERYPSVFGPLHPRYRMSCPASVHIAIELSRA